MVSGCARGGFSSKDREGVAAERRTPAQVEWLLDRHHMVLLQSTQGFPTHPSRGFLCFRPLSWSLSPVFSPHAHAAAHYQFSFIVFFFSTRVHAKLTLKVSSLKTSRGEHLSPEGIEAKASPGVVTRIMPWSLSGHSRAQLTNPSVLNRSNGACFLILVRQAGFL